MGIFRDEKYTHKVNWKTHLVEHTHKSTLDTMNWGDSTYAWIENVSNWAKITSYSQLYSFVNTQKREKKTIRRKMRELGVPAKFWNQSVWAVTHTVLFVTENICTVSQETDYSISQSKPKLKTPLTAGQLSDLSTININLILLSSFQFHHGYHRHFVNKNINPWFIVPAQLKEVLPIAIFISYRAWLLLH